MTRNKYSKFPIDNKQRVVIAYGKVHRAKEPSPKVSVHVERVDTGEKEVYMIPLNYLHDIRIGTIIQNQKSLGYSGYHKYRSEEGIKFNFDFNENEPKNVIFVKGINEDEWTIGAEHPYDNSTVNDMKLQTSTVFAKLENKNGITVYIPSLELLISGYAPGAIKLIPYLCNYPLDGAIEYIKKKYIIEQKDWFFDKIHKENFPKAKNSCIHHLVYHPVARARASRIWPSMALTEKSNEGAYIAVLPYHPEKMTITVSGFWIDEKRFMVQRIDKVLHPSGHKTIPPGSAGRIVDKDNTELDISIYNLFKVEDEDDEDTRGI